MNNIKLIDLEDIKDVNLKYAKFRINYEEYKEQFGFNKDNRKIIFIRKEFLKKINEIAKQYNYFILQDHMFYDYKNQIMVFKVRPKL